MTPVATLAAEYGISTKKAEELAKNTGVMLVKLKSGGFVAPDEKFREAARLVLRSAKRKYGSAYWFHPLIGKFQMSGAFQNDGTTDSCRNCIGCLVHLFVSVGAWQAVQSQRFG
jgi:hypothetical protein